MLILKGCSLSQSFRRGNNTLHLAVVKSDVTLVKLLLDNKINVETENNQGQTALHIACTGSCLRIVRLLVDNGCSVNKPDNDGITPIFFAANTNNVCFVRYLLQKGSKVNVVDSDGYSPLFYAIENDRCSTKLVALLLNAGAEINHKNRRKITPLGKAINILLFRKLGTRSSELKFSIIKLLIDAGSVVNDTNGFGQTFLSFAILKNHEGLVRFLLNAGCNVDGADDFGNFPLYYACKTGRIVLAKLLVEAGANLHQQNWLRCETSETCLCYESYEPYNTCRSKREVLDYLKQKSNEFPRLIDMCRTTIRKHLGKRLEMALPELQLPPILSNYIRLIETNSHWYVQ